MNLNESSHRFSLMENFLFMKLINILRTAFFIFSFIIPITIKASDDLKQDDLLSALNMIRSTGKISEADYNKALDQIQKLNQKEMKELQNKATYIIEKDPATLEKIKKAAGI